MEGAGSGGSRDSGSRSGLRLVSPQPPKRKRLVELEELPHLEPESPCWRTSQRHWAGKWNKDTIKDLNLLVKMTHLGKVWMSEGQAFSYKAERDTGSGEPPKPWEVARHLSGQAPRRVAWW